MTEQQIEVTEESLTEDLRVAQRAAEEAESNLVAAIANMRRRGWSWQRIGEVLGTSRQAAWERFHRRVKENA